MRFGTDKFQVASATAVDVEVDVVLLAAVVETVVDVEVVEAVEVLLAQRYEEWKIFHEETKRKAGYIC